MSQRRIRVVTAERSGVASERLNALLNDIPGVSIIGHAQDGLTAKLCVLSLRPDVVIMDYSLSDVRGVEVLREIYRHTPSEYKPVVIMLANHSVEQLRPSVLAAGANFLLDKSFDLETITGILELMVT